MIHSAIQALYSFENARFEKALQDPEREQRLRLKEVLLEAEKTPRGKVLRIDSSSSVERFQSTQATTEFSSYKDLIDTQRETGSPGLNRSVVRYEPTSGSTGERKWIPYTGLFLKQINRAAQAWIYDLYLSYPEMKKGRHFWSLSWIPTELRGLIDTDDTELFPAWQRYFLNKIMISHPAIQGAPTGESSWWATKVLLASCENLSFISVWSPTYAINLCREIARDRKVIQECFKTKRWMRFEKELRGFRVPMRDRFPMGELSENDFISDLWRKLELVSCWDSASSSLFRERVSSMIPRVSIQGKGLWATEGVVTIPWRGSFPLAIRSHFYEFRCLSSQKILPAWKLEPDQEVQPLLSTGSSFLRYELPDRLRVTGHLGKTPCFEFQGRIGTSDLVGEKISYQKASKIIASLQSDFPRLEIFCLATEKSPEPGYLVLGVGSNDQQDQLAQDLEKRLLAIHHYSVARQLGQLISARAKLFSHQNDLLQLLESNQIRGQNKPDSIIEIGSRP